MRLLPEDNLETMTQPRSTWQKRRVFGYLAVLLGISWASYAYFTYAKMLEPSDQLEFQSSSAEDKEEYGLNAQPSLAGMIQLMDLAPKYIPETGKHRKSGRLVVVGDVHGMKDSLIGLLDKIHFDKKQDHLILAGDMISKGPDSPGVVDLAMKLGATGIRGNHEDRIILAHKTMEAEHKDLEHPDPSEPLEKQQDMLEEESFSHGDYKDRKLVKELGETRIKWLKKCPVILRVGELGDMGEVVVVHAGLTPGVELQKQDPVLCMNMRTIKHGVPSDERDGTVWTKAWNKFQKSLPKEQRSTVIYGHDSKRGLQLEPYSMGIDTGCLKGGKLTAVVIEGGHLDHKFKVHHVNCKDGRQK